jgi:hypothetical protein
MLIYCFLVTLWKTEIYLMPLGQFEVDQSLTVTDGLVQLGLSGSGSHLF